MLKGTRAMLDQIDEFLSKGDQEAKDLAAILSALRGPDRVEEARDKKTTTMPLRSIAFPKVFAKADTVWMSERMGERIFELTDYRGWSMFPPEEFQRPSEDSRYESYGNFHFAHHIHMAADAIERKDPSSNG